ncbi:hypothetical protein BWQ96_07373 [Gracilariopsis chorda]|uniref:Uncharacterized protein n=1 Tax=Gracilariopsis chorda TaxID=448386 RepID=A0A2V3ILG6_9FLOR|nr:hypothetical protein BWQ96_07373 [Gracilariopsis chorda]|eukprot:PXF42926.1 hypothetical protein BWQ96_07373 [Gracilariopsis chorda]
MISLSSLLLRDYRYVVPVPACFLLQALFGLLYAQGVFVALVHTPQYTLAIGLASFFVSVGITLSGVSMSKLASSSPSHAQSAPVYAALAGSVGLSGQTVLALALALDNVHLLYAASVLYGTGCGCIYVASVDVLQAWVPESRGFITGVGMLCGAAGSLFGIYIYRALVAALGAPIPAMAFVGAVSAALSFAAAPMLKKPPAGWHPARDLRAGGDEENAPLLITHAAQRALHSPPSAPHPAVISVRDILRDRSFYMLVVAFAATVGPGFGLVLAYQTMLIDMFGAAISEANNLFFWITFSGLAGRLLAGIGVDALESDVGSAPRLTGGKRTNMLLLLVQIAATASLPFFIRANMLYAFTAACALIYITFSGGPVVAACLVGAVFDQVNASLAFSLVAISIGAGDMFFSWVVAMCSESTAYPRVLHDRLPRFHASDYNLFLWCTVIWSLAGLVATHFISRCDKLRAQPAAESPAQSFSSPCGASCSRHRHSSVSSVEDLFRSLGRAAKRSADETNIRVYTDMWSDT